MAVMFWHGWCEQVRVFFLASIAQQGKRTAPAFLLSSHHQTRHRRLVKKQHYSMPPRLVANWTKAPVSGNDGGADKDFFELCPAPSTALGVMLN